MKLRDHIAKLSWTAFDKLLFILYGAVSLLQIRALAPEDYALAAQLINLQTWIFIITDGSALQAIIQFGESKKERGRVSFIAFILHIAISVILSMLVFLLQIPLSNILHEPRFYDIAAILPLYSILTIPRAFMLKLMQRELDMKNVYFTNLAMFGTMSVLTFWMMWNKTFDDYNDMVEISLIGISVSSAIAIALGWRYVIFSTAGSTSWTQVLKFGLPQALMMSINNIIRQLDVFIVQLYFTTAAAGVYQSAKMLYRVFETAVDAGITLMYPTAVKLLAQNRTDQIVTVFSKAISLIIVVMISAIIFFYAGGSYFIELILGQKYAMAVPQFKLLMLSTIFLPFFILQSVELAYHRVGRLLFSVTISAIAGLLTFYIVGKLGHLWLIPLGVIVYTISFSALLVYNVRKDLPFPFFQTFFKVIPDTIAYVRSKRIRKQHTV